MSDPRDETPISKIDEPGNAQGQGRVVVLEPPNPEWVVIEEEQENAQEQGLVQEDEQENEQEEGFPDTIARKSRAPGKPRPPGPGTG